MDSDTLGLVSELIEQTCEASRNLLCSEIYINNGELGRSQVFFAAGRDLLVTMKGDIFEEICDAFKLELPNFQEQDEETLTLVCELNLLAKNAGTIVGMFVDGDDDAVLTIVMKKIVQNIANVIHLSDVLFN